MRQGFTLIELSIVLVIIGLLVGGVLGGRSLIHNGELKAVINQTARYQTAVNTFKNKYGAVPGDFANATRYWGIAGGSTGYDAACWGASNTGTNTCNGDGNGFIDTHGGYWSEVFHAWKQLANEGLIEGQYNGVSSGAMGTYIGVAGTNIPAGAIDGSAYMFWLHLAGATDSNWWDNGAGNVLLFGKQTSGGASAGPIMTGEDAWSIDSKIDDGMPGRGDVWTFHNSTSCTSSTAVADAAIATYVKNSSTVACMLVFYLDHYTND